MGPPTMIRIAHIIAPDRYFAYAPCARLNISARIGLLARKIETLVVRIIYPEMTADMIPAIFRVDHDPGDASVCVRIDDLVGAFDRLEPEADILTAFDFGIRQDCERRAA